MSAITCAAIHVNALNSAILDTVDRLYLITK